MPRVPNIVGQSVGTVTSMPIFVNGVWRLAVMPPNAPQSATITHQDPEAGYMLDIGGVVTAMVASQSKQ